jgi:predicted nucleotidyltransferase
MGMTERLIEGLPDDTQKLLQTYVKEVKGAFGEQLEGMLLYGSAVRGEFTPGRSNLNILLLVSSYDSAVLKKYSALHRQWSKEQIVVPLFLTEEELHMSAAVFPLEFLEIQEQHRVLGGRDPFIGFQVKTDRLREAVVQGLASNVFRLRQRYVEGGGSDDATLILLPLSITSTLPLLRGVQRLLGRPVLSHSDAVIKDVAEQLKLDLQGLLEAWLLKRGQISPGPHEVPRLFDRYLQAATVLSRAVEQLPQSVHR